MRTLVLAMCAALAAAGTAFGAEAARVCDASACRDLRRRDVDAALADLRARPRDMRLEAFGQEFFLDVTPDECGKACRRAVLRVPGMGVTKTFDGPDSAAVMGKFLAFIRSEDFLGRLLMKLGPDALRWVLSAFDAPPLLPPAAFEPLSAPPAF